MARKWWTLIAVSVATFMLLLDITVVNTALPSIQKDLSANFTDLQWVIDAYTLVLASVAEVRVEQHEPRQLALAAGGRLERNRIEPGHLEQDPLQLPFELQRALRCVVLRQRVEPREPG